jgi:D-glycero-beta-D-manno-heptose 1-phosphate adenylyltransferase
MHEAGGGASAAACSAALPAPAFEAKIADRSDLAERVRGLARPVVFTNGVFDLLHRGHVTYLAQARALGASLVVAVNSDASVRQLAKGRDRPINTEADRAAILAALESVSLVTVFAEPVPLQVLQIVRPEVYVKGGDYRIESTPEAQLAQSWNARLVAIAFAHQRSTTALLERLRRSGAAP